MKERRIRGFWPRLAYALAWAAGAWERLWPSLWPAAALLALFVLLAFADILPALPGWAHALTLAVFGLGTAVLIFRAGRRFVSPTRAETLRRLERDSGLAHRPLTEADDRQSAGLERPESRALWSRHRERRAKQQLRLRPAPPRSGLAAGESRRVHGGMAAALVLALAVGWGEWGPRLDRAVTPGALATATASEATIDLIITPPAYTGRPPLYRSDDAASGVIEAPVGSRIIARVSGGAVTPELALGDSRQDFTALEGGHYEASAALTGDATLTVTQGRATLGEWTLRGIPDQTPVAAFDGAPEPTERGVLRIGWRAADDYGVAEVALTMVPAESAPEGLGRLPEIIPISEPARPRPEIDGLSFQDLAAHPWAGQEVALTLTAADQAGQSGASETLEMTLPQRTFHHPVARAVIEQRRRLFQSPSLSAGVAEMLSDIALRPEAFGDDLVVFLSLRMAARRLTLQPDNPPVGSVAQLLWETALRIEDGQLSLAAMRLREAEEALRAALDQEASAGEIAQLSESLRNAMDEYLDAMEQTLRESRDGETPPLPDDAQQSTSRDSLQQMLEAIQEMAESGDHEGAAELLAELQELLETIEEADVMQGGQAGAEMRAMLDDLENMIETQQELMDGTFRESRRNVAPDDPERQEFIEETDRQQDVLRRRLGNTIEMLVERTGEVPTTLGDGELAMRRAQSALREDALRQASESQGEAVEFLTEGLREALDQMMEQMSGEGMAEGPGTEQRRRGEDPLGRRVEGEGQMAIDDVAIPDERATDRARAILEELRRRASDRQRPQDELNYIERLLERF